MSLHRENARLRRRIMANAEESDAAASGVAKMAEALAEARAEIERLTHATRWERGTVLDIACKDGTQLQVRLPKKG